VIPKLFVEDDVKFDLSKVDFSEVIEGWNNKVWHTSANTPHATCDSHIFQTGYYAYTRPAISKRASDVRKYLFQRPEANV
jgi:hypothetical protein